MNSMNKSWFFVFCISLWATIAQAQSLTESQWQVSLKNQAQSIQLQHFKGQPLWIDFWASWCPPCRMSFPWLDEMQSKYAKYGFKVIAINVDENPQDAVDFLKQHPVRFNIYFDPKGQAPATFNIKGMPTSVLVDRYGKIHLFHVGFEENQKQALENKIVEILNVR